MGDILTKNTLMPFVVGLVVSFILVLTVYYFESGELIGYAVGGDDGSAYTICEVNGGECIDTGECPIAMYQIDSSCQPYVPLDGGISGDGINGEVVRDITGNVVGTLGICCVVNYCGDSVVHGDELCDESNLNEETCESLGFDGGVLYCTTGCVFDTSGCYYGVDCSEVSCQDNWLDCQGEYTTDCSETIPGSSPTCGEFGDCSGDPAENLCEDGVTPCTTCDCNQCPLNLACVSDPSVDTPTESPSGNSGSSSQTTCASVSGTCTDFCDAGYVAYNENLLDLTCNQVYDTSVPLICCASEDAQLSPRGTTSGDEDDTTSGGGSNVRDLSGVLGIPRQSGSNGGQSSTVLSSFQKLISGDITSWTSIVWIVVILGIVVTIITVTIHKKIRK